MTTMKALVKAKAEKGIWMQDILIPEVGYNDVLIKVRKTAICGTDLHIYLWDEWAKKTIPVPMQVGHEFMGVIEKMGEGVKRFRVGARVSGEGHIVCGHCRNCRAGRGHLCRNTLGVGVHRPGAFAEYLVIPESNVVEIPNDITDDVASIFDPFGNAVHTTLSFDLVGEDVLVTGAGSIGIMAAMTAKFAGARKVVVTDITQARIDRARKMGIEYAINVSQEKITDVIPKIGMKEGFDVGLEMSGSANAFRDMIDNMNNGGKIAILGISPANFEIDWNKVIFKMLHLKGIYGREMFETWYKMIALVQKGLDVSGIISHHLPIADYQKGFDLMEEGKCGKVILNWE